MNMISSLIPQNGTMQDMLKHLTSWMGEDVQSMLFPPAPRQPQTPPVQGYGQYYRRRY